MTLDPKLRRKLLKIQKKERTHYEIYKKLSTSIKDENNRIILKDISEDEKNHYLFWKDLTKKRLKTPGVENSLLHVFSKLFIP